jgi:hypothetical protein
MSSRVSNCRTVERYEGDLDPQFDQDHLRNLLERMTYSTEEERQSRPARHRFQLMAISEMAVQHLDQQFRCTSNFAKGGLGVRRQLVFPLNDN